MDSQTVAAGETAKEPEDPKKGGYKFGGWYADSELTSLFSFATKIEKDTTLYAKWIDDSVPTYKVTVNPITNGTVTAYPSAGAAEGEEVELEIMPEQGYALDTLTVDGADVNTSVVGVLYRFQMPGHDVAVSATFKKTEKIAGSISYATTTVSKTTDDEAFTNTLTKTGNGTVSYTSDNTAVATVDASTGEVTIVGAGTATITATVADSDTYTYATKTASYTVTVVTAKSTAETPSIAQADCTFSPVNGTSTLSNANITTSMEYSIDTGTTWIDVTSNGSIASLATGTVQIRVKETGDKLASEAVSITVPQVLKINELVGPYTGDKLTCEYYAGETWQALVNRYDLILVYSGRAAFGRDGFIYYENGGMVPVTDFVDNTRTYEVQ